MRKSLWFIALILLVFSLVSCKNNDPTLEPTEEDIKTSCDICGQPFDCPICGRPYGEEEIETEDVITEKQKYIITFNNNGHGVTPELLTDVTSLPSELPALTADGYTFGGWFTDEALTVAAVAGSTITSNTTLYAKWTEVSEPTPKPEAYVVTYNVNGHGEAPSSLTEVTALPTELPVLSADGYTFDGWYLDEELTVLAVAGSTITSNTTLYAKWTEVSEPTPKPETYVVTYNVNGHGEAPSSLTEVTTLPTELPVLSADGYTFDGWYLDEELTVLAVAGSTITANATLYAKWTEVSEPEPETYTVTYNVNGHGEAPVSLTEVTALPEELPVLTADGYTFDGWYLDEELTVLAVAGSTITANTTLYAKWTEVSEPEPETYTIEFNSNGHGATPASLTEVTALPTELPVLEEEGYLFEGWFTNVALTTEAVAGSSITEDTTLYAKWSEVVMVYQITFEINGHGEAPESLTEVTALPTTLPTLTADGYTFEGWYLDEELTVLAIAGSTITANTTLYAKWTEVEDNSDTVVSQIKRNAYNRTYLEVDGKPFAIRGGQLRVDGFLNRHPDYTDAPAALTWYEIEQYFIAAKNCGLNTLELALEWRRVETSKDNYDFTLVDKLLELTNKYDLKCEFLWFSINMCGDSVSFQVPDYIVNDPVTYPRYSGVTGIEGGMYGKYFWLIPNNQNLMEREALALEKLMEHVYEWNKENGKKNPLIGIQIQNETDGLLRWRLSQRELKLNGSSVDPTSLWNAILESLDNGGKAVKRSKYKIYTRCNMTVTLGMSEFPQFPGMNFSPKDVLDLEGIDIVGDDCYNENPSTVNKAMNEYRVDDNYPHVAENMGDYASSPTLFLTTYQAGASYMFYDFATPTYFIYLNQGSSYQMDQGLLNSDFTYKDHTEETVNVINGIKKMGSVLPLVNSTNFAIFNATTQTPQTNLTQTICTENIKIKYVTTNGGLAFAIEDGEYLYLYSTKECKMSIENASFVYKADLGYFNYDEFVVESSDYISTIINVSANTLYRVKIRSINETVTSTTNQNV